MSKVINNLRLKFSNFRQKYALLIEQLVYLLLLIIPFEALKLLPRDISKMFLPAFNLGSISVRFYYTYRVTFRRWGSL